MIPKLIIYKQKRKVFAFSSASSCLSLLPPTSPNTILICLKSNAVKCSKSIRRSNSSEDKERGRGKGKGKS